MFLRTSSIVFLSSFALASCGFSDPESPEPSGAEVECAIGAGSEFATVCTVESLGLGEFLIHHPDGGFRRVQYDAATDQIGVGDGADSLKVSPASTSQTVEFAVGKDRYRLPSAILRAPTE